MSQTPESPLGTPYNPAPGQPYTAQPPPQQFPGQQFHGQQLPGQQFPGQQFPGQQYAPAPPVKKKRKKWPIVLLILALLLILFIGGCFAVLNSGVKAVNKSVAESSQASTPREVTAGTAFTVGKHQTLAGWEAVNEDGMFNVKGKVKNTSSATSSAFETFKFLSKSGEVLGSVDCNSDQLEPGQTQVLNCLPDGVYSKKYDKVTVEATF